jgi:dihydrofolate synthase/folylpolyglutamate synthase
MRGAENTLSFSSRQRSSLEPYFERKRGDIKPGAHRMQILLDALGATACLDIPSVLVAGTNGKGTVCAYLESMLRHHAFKTGLYTSPHLVDPTERMRIAGVPVSEAELRAALGEVEKIFPHCLPDATFFEITTAAAFLLFLKNEIEVLICEVGLGGRYDSTNVLSPLVSVLTSVGLDHTDLLGKTEQKIAFDKAFVSRRNRLFVVGKLSADAHEGVLSTVQRTGAHLIEAQNEVCKNSSPFGKEFLEQFSGRVQLNHLNLQTALVAFQAFSEQKKFAIKNDVLVQSIEAMRWPGRFDVRVFEGRTVVFEASHNSAGLTYFLQQWQQSAFANKECNILFASLGDKDWEKMIPLLSALGKKMILTTFSSQRALSAADLNAAARFSSNIHVEENLEQALALALNLDKAMPLIITGSIAFLGETMLRLQICPYAHVEKRVLP